MKTSLAFACLAFALAAPLHAGRQEAAALEVAMKLPDAHNYTWSTEVVDDARSYTIEGKTDLADKRDLSLVTMPTIAAYGRVGGGPTRGRGSSGSEATLAFKGDDKFVLETPDGWKNPDELASVRGGRGSGGYGGFGGRGGYGGYGGRGGRMRGGSSDANGQRTPPAYSNLQSTLSRPHEEISILVAGYTELTAEADGVSGKLSETNAKLLLVHAGQKEITPLSASGTFRLWVKDGALVKYEVKLEGKLAVTTPGGRREVEVHQTATTTLRDVDATKVEIPDAAKKKLGA